MKCTDKDIKFLKNITTILSKKSGVYLELKSEHDTFFGLKDSTATTGIEAHSTFYKVKYYVLIFNTDGRVHRCGWEYFIYKPDFIQKTVDFIQLCTAHTPCETCPYRMAYTEK